MNEEEKLRRQQFRAELEVCPVFDVPFRQSFPRERHGIAAMRLISSSCGFMANMV